MRTFFLHLFVFAFIFSTISCSEDTKKEVIDQFEVAKSTKSRETDPSVSTAQMDELVTGNTSFALDLYSTVKETEEGNFFYSPFSISLALAMTYAGAEGTTETQMADTMEFTLPEPELHSAFNALDLDLQSRGTGDASQFRLNIANAIWGQTGYHFEQSFLDTIALNYGSGLNLLDFMADPEACRTIINDWVEEKTEDRIQDLLPEGSIGSDTRMVITNAIYFWGEWVEMFSRDMTAAGSFHKDDGTDVSVDFMHIEASYNYVEGTGYEAIELPYKGDDTSMVIIAPDAGTLAQFEATLDATLLAGIIASLSPTGMLFSMPKFEFEHRLDVKALLMEMGMEAPFDGAVADFSGLNGGHDLVITDILHKAFVAVNEDGTEAAAATAVVVGETSVPANIVDIDRPFIFLIRDKVTGTILFIGRIADPS
ncbi:serpin family protein [Myxococcota bacterium]|nr:serpin family protein [Myxococcota bacterium]